MRGGGGQREILNNNQTKKFNLSIYMQISWIWGLKQKMTVCFKHFYSSKTVYWDLGHSLIDYIQSPLAVSGQGLFLMLEKRDGWHKNKH